MYDYQEPDYSLSGGSRKADSRIDGQGLQVKSATDNPNVTTKPSSEEKKGFADNMRDNIGKGYNIASALRKAAITAMLG